MARRLKLLAGAFGVLLTVVLMVVAAIEALQHPANVSRFDRTWTLLFIGILAAIGLLHWVWRGRLVLLGIAFTVLMFLGVTAVRAGTAPALLALCWLLSVSAGLGNGVLKALVPGLKASKLEWLLLAISLGLGVLALLTLALGILQWLYTGIAYAVLIGLTVLVWPRSLRSAWPAFRDRLLNAAEAWRTTDLRPHAVVAGSISMSLVGALLWALAPAVHFDTLLYHLSTPAFYVQHHGLVEVAERYQSYWAHNAEMLYTLALLLVGQPLPTLIHWTCGLLTTGLTFALGRRLGGRRVGLVAAVLYCSTPLVSSLAGTGHNDLTVALYVCGVLCCFVAWWQESDDKWLVVAGILTGLAMGTKLNAVIALAPLSACIALTLLLRSGLSLHSAVGLVRFGFPAVVLSAPWLARDWLWTGNPIFPFRNTLFRSPQWPLENMYIVGRSSNSSGLLPLLKFVRLPWDLLRRPRTFSEWVPPGFVGGLPLLALPWLGLGQGQPSQQRRRLLYVLFGLTLAVTLLWSQAFRYLRHLLQILPLFAVLAAMMLEALWLRLRKGRWGRWAATLGLLLALCYVAATRVIEIVNNWQLPERYPYRVVLGSEAREDFLSRALPVYDALQFLNQQGDGEHKILSIDSSCWLYTTSRVYAPGGSPEVDRILYSLPPGPDLAQALEGEGFEFLLVDRFHTKADPQRFQLAVLDNAFIQEFARLEFARHNMYVYRFVFSGSAAVSRGGENLLANATFEATDADGRLSGWFVYGSTTVDRTGAEAHSGKVGVQMDADSRTFQDVPIESGRLYTLGHWSRADRADQMAWLHINWLDAQKQLLDVSIDVIATSYDWQWRQMSVTAPDDARFAQVYLSVDAKSEVWFDDVALVEGTP
jgi:hypothetical protein